MSDGQIINLAEDPAALPAVVAVDEDASPILAAVQVMAVKDDDDEATATELLVQIKAALTGAERARLAVVKPIKDHAKWIDETFKQRKGPLEQAEATLKTRILAYRQQVERERQEEIQRQLAEQREREAAEAAARAEAEEAERARIAAAELAAAPALEPEDVTAAGVEHVALFEGDGTPAAAPAPTPEPPPAPAPVPQPLDLPPARPSVTRTESGSAQVRRRWKFEVEDAMQVPREYLMVDDRLLRAAVADGERSIAGVRIFQEADLAVRAR